MTAENPIDQLLRDDNSTDFDFHFNNHIPHFNSPEKNLMMSVLLYAVIDYISKKKKQFDSANEWIFAESQDDDWLFSFENVCFTLGIKSNDFRRKLVELKKYGVNLDKKAIKLKHLNPAPGNRTKISINTLYKLERGDG